MSTNGRSGASKLFDLFRDRETFDVKDAEGNVVERVTFQALDWQQNNLLIKQMEQARLRVRAEMEKNQERDGIVDSIAQLSAEQLIDIVINIERPIATNVADLAPNGTEEETEAARLKEKEATEKWEAARRKELVEMEITEVREILIRRQESLFIQARAVQDYINESLCQMLVDPETGDTLFASQDDNLPAHESRYIGRLMPEVRNQLLKGREEFLAKRSEKQVRKAAEDRSFLASGESPKSDTATPGETTETPPRSRRTRSISTPAAAG